MTVFKIYCITVTVIDMIILPYLIRNRKAVRATFRKWCRDYEKFDGRWMSEVPEVVEQK